ncbi:MAG: hypothetical protein QM652_10275 [Legionella sp.]|uniref:hypothetical protein n=1 Tax=Legionella sp. TaxID=459 RepID=UPI0039E56035
MPKYNGKLTRTNRLLKAVKSHATCALTYGVAGSIGKSALSFFSPSLTSQASGFASFVLVGAVAFPFMKLLDEIIMDLMKDSAYLKAHPNLKTALTDTAIYLSTLASITAATALLGLPMAATIFSIMIIPTAATVIGLMYNAINSCFDGDNEVVDAEPGLRN